MSAAAFAFRPRPPRSDGSVRRNPVRAHSKPAGGEWEREWTCRLSPGELARHARVARAQRRRLAALRRAAPDDARRRELAVPSKNGLDILEALVAMAAGGRRLLVLSYRELAARADCSLATVRRQIALLKAAGMLDWQRRCRRTEAEAQFGTPQWEQAENVYALKVPAGVKRQHQRAAAERDAQLQAEVMARATALRASGQAAPPPRKHLQPPTSVPGRLEEGLARLGRAMGRHETGK